MPRIYNTRRSWCHKHKGAVAVLVILMTISSANMCFWLMNPSEDAVTTRTKVIKEGFLNTPDHDVKVTFKPKAPIDGLERLQWEDFTLLSLYKNLSGASEKKKRKRMMDQFMRIAHEALGFDSAVTCLENRNLQRIPRPKPSKKYSNESVLYRPFDIIGGTANHPSQAGSGTLKQGRLMAFFDRNGKASTVSVTYRNRCVAWSGGTADTTQDSDTPDNGTTMSRRLRLPDGKHQLQNGHEPQKHGEEQAFCSTFRPWRKHIKFLVNKGIPGWVDALSIMCEGDAWEIIIPWRLAYPQGHHRIPPHTALVFQVQLEKVLTHGVPCASCTSARHRR